MKAMEGAICVRFAFCGKSLPWEKQPEVKKLDQALIVSGAIRGGGGRKQALSGMSRLH